MQIHKIIFSQVLEMRDSEITKLQNRVGDLTLQDLQETPSYKEFRSLGNAFENDSGKEDDLWWEMFVINIKENSFKNITIRFWAANLKLSFLYIYIHFHTFSYIFIHFRLFLFISIRTYNNVWIMKVSSLQPWRETYTKNNIFIKTKSKS